MNDYLIGIGKKIKEVRKASKMSVFRIGVEAEEGTEEEIKGMQWPERSKIFEEKSKERAEYFLAT